MTGYPEVQPLTDTGPGADAGQKPVVVVVSFGYGHGAPPQAHVVFDVRDHFRDPHLDPELRNLTASDPRIVRTVTGTMGVPELITAITGTARAFYLAPHRGWTVIAIGCAGGRHRAPVIAGEAALRLYAEGIPVIHQDRDLHRPLLSGRAGNAYPRPDHMDDENQLPSAAALRQWLADHGWTIVGTGPAGSMHAPPDGAPVAVPHGDSDQLAIRGALERIAERTGRPEHTVAQEIRTLFADMSEGRTSA